MRVCDRCGGKNVAEKLVSQIDGAEYDLCKECREVFQEFVNPKRGPGPPPKEK